MDYSKPTLLVISGPNGAGKSTHIQSMLPEAFVGIWSFDRDQARSEFELELTAQNIPNTLITKKATELMEEKLVGEMKRAITNKSHFVLETPLSHADYWKYLDLFENNGYQIQLNYLCLDKVSDVLPGLDSEYWRAAIMLRQIPLKAFTRRICTTLMNLARRLKLLNFMMA